VHLCQTLLPRRRPTTSPFGWLRKRVLALRGPLSDDRSMRACVRSGRWRSWACSAPPRPHPRHGHPSTNRTWLAAEVGPSGPAARARQGNDGHRRRPWPARLARVDPRVTRMNPMPMPTLGGCGQTAHRLANCAEVRPLLQRGDCCTARRPLQDGARLHTHASSPARRDSTWCGGSAATTNASAYLSKLG